MGYHVCLSTLANNVVNLTGDIVGSGFLGSNIVTHLGNSALQNIANTIASESSRAISAENNLSNQMVTETNRAISAENALQSSLSTLSATVAAGTGGSGSGGSNVTVTVSANSIANALGYVPANNTALANYATLTNLGGVSANVGAEISRATAAEAAISQNTVTNLAAISAVNSNVITLAANLAANTASLATSLGTVNSNVVSEISRAKLAETVINSNVTTVSASLSSYVPLSSIGQAGGVAPLNGAGQIPTSYMSSSLTGALFYKGTWDASANIPALVNGGTYAVGTFFRVSNAGTNLSYSWNVGDDLIYDGSAWDKIDGLASEVVSVAGKTGVVTLSISDIASGASLANVATVSANVVALQTSLASYATTSALNAANSAIVSEQIRAQTAESNLTTNLGTVNSNVVAEISRAKSSEATLNSNIVTEVSRATSAEAIISQNTVSLAASLASYATVSGTV